MEAHGGIFEWNTRSSGHGRVLSSRTRTRTCICVGRLGTYLKPPPQPPPTFFSTLLPVCSLPHAIYLFLLSSVNSPFLRPALGHRHHIHSFFRAALGVTHSFPHLSHHLVDLDRSGPSSDLFCHPVSHTICCLSSSAVVADACFCPLLCTSANTSHGCSTFSLPPP